MPAFSESRNIEISTLDYIKSKLNANWSSPTVSLQKSFVRVYDKNVTLPVVCARLADTESNPKEVGTKTKIHKWNITIDIFAKSDGMKIDLAAAIMSYVEEGSWTYNEYSRPSGGGTSLDTVTDGLVVLDSIIENNPVDFGDTVDIKDRFRHFIQIVVRKS